MASNLVRSNVTDDEDDDTASDEDFNPDAQLAHEEDSLSSSDEDTLAGTAAAPKKQGAKRARAQDDLDGELDSGDEVTIRERKQKRRRKGKGKGKGKGVDADVDFSSDNDEDEGGTGGFIRTRAQRQVEKVERHALASTKGSTLDVDSVWSRLASLPVGRLPETEASRENDEEYITIKRTTRFAGQLETEERSVLRSSKEAQIWLEEQENERRKKKDTGGGKENLVPDDEAQPPPSEEGDVEAPTASPKLQLRRPIKRIFKYEPNPTGEVKTLPPRLQLRWPRDKGPFLLTSTSNNITTTTTTTNAGIVDHRALPKLPAAAKLNTVQKSKYDWANYVDQNKLAAELDEYGKSKESYVGRKEFLGRAEMRREDERRAAKAKVV